MKSMRLTAIFGVIVFAAVGILWTLGLVSGEAAQDISSKSIGVVLILMVATFLVGTLLRSSKPVEQTKNDSSGGPRF